jgi:hypothetical protein
MLHVVEDVGGKQVFMMMMCMYATVSIVADFFKKKTPL